MSFLAVYFWNSSNIPRKVLIFYKDFAFNRYLFHGIMEKNSALCCILDDLLNLGKVCTAVNFRDFYSNLLESTKLLLVIHVLSHLLYRVFVLQGNSVDILL